MVICLLPACLGYCELIAVGGVYLLLIVLS